ncbi:MAG TPA: right-handed parallel beta-helix repeat-containing protein [Streptosporangiaceae bacterium]
MIDATKAPTHVTGGPPVVELNFGGHTGLWFAAGSGGSALMGVAAGNASGNGVTLVADSITLTGDYIGLNLAGKALGNRGSGVFAAPGSSRNRIGLNPKGIVGLVANVISGNSGSGIWLSGSSHDTVVANRIGTNPAGTSAIGNHGSGIAITARSDSNEIGGTRFVNPATGQLNNPTGSKGTVTPVFVVPPLGNLISGNAGTGVLISTGSVKNTLNGNFIGTTGSGDGRIRNGGNGVWIDGASSNSLVGCKVVNNPFVYYNVVSGNGQNGLRITNSDNTTVQGNFFGIGANNTTIVRNRLNGIEVDGTSADTQVGGVIPLGNVSAGNGQNGIEVTGKASKFTTFNTFGGLLAFKGAAANGQNGLLVTGSAKDILARTNVFSGNTRNGIEVSGSVFGVQIDPDIIGLNTNGSATLPNGGDGVLITGGAHGLTVGGSLVSVIPQNTFSGNRGYGVAITGQAFDVVVFKSFIGMKILGVKAFGNGKGGVLIGGTAHHVLIGFIHTTRSNIISGNTGNGVTLLAGTHDNTVLNNYIGADRFGLPLPNTGHPVVNLGRSNVIQGNKFRPFAAAGPGARAVTR